MEKRQLRHCINGIRHKNFGGTDSSDVFGILRQDSIIKKKSGTVNSPQSLWQSLPEILMSPESAPNGKHSGKGNPRISGTLRPSQPGTSGVQKLKISVQYW